MGGSRVDEAPLASDVSKDAVGFTDSRLCGAVTAPRGCSNLESRDTGCGFATAACLTLATALGSWGKGLSSHAPGGL